MPSSWRPLARQRAEPTRPMAFAAGLVFGITIFALEEARAAWKLSPQAEQLAFLFALVFCLLGPVLLFVVGTPHLSMRSGITPKAAYWASLGQVAVRAACWLAGSTLGFIVLRAVLGVPDAAS